MKMRPVNKNKKGVALIWAITAFVIVLLVVTGILMMAQVYHKRENTSILKTRADYYARSGINILSSQITSGDIDPAADIMTNSGSPVSYVVEIQDGTEKIDVSVKCSMPKASYQMTMEASYSIANVSKTVYGRMEKTAGVWKFMGFYVN
jgi:hypothetical protein